MIYVLGLPLKQFMPVLDTRFPIALDQGQQKGADGSGFGRGEESQIDPAKHHQR